MNRLPSVRLGHGAALVLIAGLLGGGTIVTAADSSAAPARAGLVLHPTQGPPNAIVSFSGSGYCASASCGPVTVAFNNATVAYPIAVHGDGTISGAFDVPSGPNGYQRVVATQPGANLSATALFFVGTSLPAPTGPRPVVSYVPPGVTPAPVHSTVPLSPVTTPPTTAPTTPDSPDSSPSSPASTSPAVSAESTATPAAAVIDHRASSTQSAWWWAAVGGVLVVGAVAGWLIRRRRLQ